MTGSTNPENIQRQKIKRIFRQKPILAGSLAKCLRTNNDGSMSFNIDPSRLRKVILKLARCHIAYELGIPHFDQPIHIGYCQLSEIRNELRDSFETLPETTLLPEVGSRAMQRQLTTDQSAFSGWVDVQENQYRYMVFQSGLDFVRIVISEFIACEVAWG